MKRLKQLTALYGPSGREARVAEYIEKQLPTNAEVRRDPMGNLIVHLGGAGTRLVFASHMDTVGMMVTRIDDGGYCYFTNVGGLDPASIAQQAVVFENGATGVVCISDDKVGKEIKLTDLYLDLGARDRVEAQALVSVGDMAMFAPQYHTAGSRVLSTFLDNRAGCEILLRAMEVIKEPKNDLYFVFTAQEEIGTRGAGPAAFGIDGAVGIAVDVTATDDVPGATHDGTAKLGAGAGIKVLDHSVLCRNEIISAMERAAQARDIPVQKDIMKTGGTDAGAMATVRAGMMAGGISLPCRYTHAPVEVCDKEDLAACARLVAAMAETEIVPC